MLGRNRRALAAWQEVRQNVVIFFGFGEGVTKQTSAVAILVAAQQ
jgi:hypothetical protein